MSDQVEVKFKRDCSLRFTGTDLEAYGPFDVFDTAELPEANAQVLEDLGYVERI
ncbi:MAG: hypothetical protein SVW02_04305 [Candidatus Nanohaloarchaea archaeon]|nr:hypothetical protein [Candidatus Nanohaloarchaea archaeon]